VKSICLEVAMDAGFGVRRPFVAGRDAQPSAGGFVDITRSLGLVEDYRKGVRGYRHGALEFCKPLVGVDA
jgi:hypothetical protein